MKSFGLSVVGSSGVNGDRYYISADNKVLVVSDGASGAFDKVAAATICIDTIEANDYSKSGLRTDEYIAHCIKDANDKLIDRSQLDGALSFGTITMAVIDGNRLYIGAVGDTPAFLIHENTISKIIEPKKRYSDLIRFGVLTKEAIERAVSSLPNQMWSQFDNFLPMIIPDIAKEEHEFADGDIVIICTDGISDWIENNEFIGILRKTSSLEEGCHNILSLVNERCPLNKRDDMTIVAAGLRGHHHTI